MFLSSRNRPYDSISTKDLDLIDEEESVNDEYSLPFKALFKTPWTPLSKIVGLCSFAAFVTVVVFAFMRLAGYPETNTFQQSVQAGSASGHHCTKPYYRREWRSLSHREKISYLDAVNCLARTPSVLRDNGTVYDDFPWVHYKMSHMTHATPAFLTWHRRFTAVYEKYLQTKCGYRGAVPYWDWTLDWEDPPGSPVFSSIAGFGGNGDFSAPESVGEGHCVTQGPFANLRPIFYGQHDRPHCFSRGFTSNFSIGYSISPVAIENIMDSKDYEEFFLAMINGPHNTIPNGVRGDFWSFTAPYDPIHFLHHAQIDRLWYHWQHKNIKTRLHEYSGKREGNAEVRVSLDDVLPLAGLDEDLTVAQVMDTEGFGMCYRYA